VVEGVLLISRPAATPALSVTVDVAEVIPVDVKTRVYVPTAPVIVKSAKVATPLVQVGVVFESTPLGEPL
jgi:hypothetical protein